MKCQNKVNCAIIGVGRLGRKHAENLAYRVPGADLVAVVAQPLEEAQRVARECNARIAADNYKEVVARADIDAVIIAAPSALHYEMALFAISHNKHVFCEKPLALTLAESEEICERVKGYDKVFQVGFMRRFDRGYSFAKKKIEEGLIGEPISFRGISRDPECPPMEFIAKSGGIFLDLSLHDYDLARWLMGQEVKRVRAIGGAYVYPELINYSDVDNAVTTLVFENGTYGQVEASRNARYGADIRTEIFGSEGSIAIGYLQHTPAVMLTREGVIHDVVPDFSTRFDEAFLLEMIDFIDCIQKGRKPLVGVEDGRAAVEIAVAATKSCREGVEVVL